MEVATLYILVLLTTVFSGYMTASDLLSWLRGRQFWNLHLGLSTIIALMP